MDYPKGREENLAWRVKILTECEKDPDYKEKMRRLFHEDIIFAFNAFYYTYDPRKRPLHQIPFATWEFQDPAILDLQEAVRIGKDRVWEKTRDMGATWMALLVFHHEWISPIGGADFLLGSRIEDYVDKKGNMRTLFEKLRYAHYRLPKWLWPKGFHHKKHDNYMRFLNPETGAAIEGESNNPNFSTGGRYAGVLFDEFAKWESTDEAAWTSAGDATPCRVAVSTPFGAAGQYYNLVTDGRTKRTTLHWKIHPEKSLGISCIWPPPNEDDKGRLGDDWFPDEVLSSAWYERECLRRTAKEIAQELDIDYIGAGHPVFDGKALIGLKFFHKVPDKPILWGKLDIEELKLEELDKDPQDWEGYVVIYEKVDPFHRYAMGVDVAEGKTDGDYSVVTIVDRMTKNIVVNYFSKIDEVLLARVVKILSDYYSPEVDSPYAPWVGIETIGPGLATFDLCVLLEVTNLFMAPRYDTTKGTVSYKKGFRTDSSSRNELISGIRQYLIGRTGDINSQRIIGELLNFVRSKTGKAEAKSGAHDDEVMSFGIALQVDEIAPLDYGEVKKARAEFRREEFQVVDREDLKIEDEDASLEGRCMADVLLKQGLREDNWKEFYDEGYY